MKKINIQPESIHEQLLHIVATEYIECIPTDEYKNVMVIGESQHDAALLHNLGFNVVYVSPTKPKYPELKWTHITDIDYAPQCEIIWSHYQIQKSNDPIKELTQMWNLLPKNGVLLLTVPDATERVISNNLAAYNIVSLAYHLAVAGFDCSSLEAGLEHNHLRIKVEKCDDLTPGTTSLDELRENKAFDSLVCEEIQRTNGMTIKSFRVDTND